MMLENQKIEDQLLAEMMELDDEEGEGVNEASAEEEKEEVKILTMEEI